jgi:transposase
MTLIPGITFPTNHGEPFLAYFDTFGASNGPTEAINGVIETTRRIARGFRNFSDYRLRCLLVASGHRPYRNKQTNHA